MDAVEKILYVGGGGFLGANARYWIGGWLQTHLGATFPWQTLIINVTGSLFIGFFMGLVSATDIHSNYRLLVAIGILGGYTTYSTFAYEAITLLSQRSYVWALFYIQGTAMLTVFAAWVGIVLSRLVLGGNV